MVKSYKKICVGFLIISPKMIPLLNAHYIDRTLKPVVSNLFLTVAQTIVENFPCPISQSVLQFSDILRSVYDQKKGQRTRERNFLRIFKRSQKKKSEGAKERNFLRIFKQFPKKSKDKKRSSRQSPHLSASFVTISGKKEVIA